MKHLRQYIRKMILETVYPKIEELVQRLDGSNSFVEILELSQEHAIIRILSKDHNKRKEFGRIEIESGPYWNQPCLGAFTVVWVNADTLGLGPLLYDLAIEIASQQGSGLVCDRGSVSHDAYDVWEKYISARVPYGDVEMKQLDISEDPQTADKFDDCPTDSSREHYAERVLGDKGKMDHLLKTSDKQGYINYFFSKEDPLSKVYYKQSNPVIDMLGDRIDWNSNYPSWMNKTNQQP